VDDVILEVELEVSSGLAKFLVRTKNSINPWSAMTVVFKLLLD
jgi:hypothetical protein